MFCTCPLRVRLENSRAKDYTAETTTARRGMLPIWIIFVSVLCTKDSGGTLVRARGQSLPVGRLADHESLFYKVIRVSLTNNGSPRHIPSSFIAKREVLAA